MTSLLLDLRTALLRLRAAPWFTLFSVVTLAVAVAVSTGIYSGMRALFWPSRGVPDAAGLFPVLHGDKLVIPGISWPDFEDLRQQQSSLEQLSASRPLRLAVAGRGVAAIVSAEAVTANYFAMLRARPVRGRLLQPSDEVDRARVAVVSETFWHTRLRSDPSVVGRYLDLAGERFEIVGVTSFRGFFPFLPTSVWLPSSTVVGDTRLFLDPRDRRWPSLVVWGRLKDRVGVPRASSDVSLIARRLDAAYPSRPGSARQWRIGRSLVETSNSLPALFGIIVAVAVVVVLVASVNLGNLALARGTSRRNDNAIRSALGASRLRLIREHLIEMTLLTGTGAALGWALLAVGLRWLSLQLPLPDRNLQLTIDANLPAFLAALAFTVLATLVGGLWPAVSSTSKGAKLELGAGTAAAQPRWRLHRSIVAWQVCGSVSLVLVAAVLSEAVEAQSRGSRNEDLSIAIAQLDFAANLQDPATARRTLDRIIRGLEEEPRIQSVAAATGLPFGGMARVTSVRNAEPNQPGQQAWLIAASSGIFSALGRRLSQGGLAEDWDRSAGRRVAVIGDRLARTLFGAADPVGQIILFRTGGGAADAHRVVGVVEDAETEEKAAVSTAVFVPLDDEVDVNGVIVVRARSDKEALSTLRSAIGKTAPDLVVAISGTGREILGRRSYVLRKAAQMAMGLGALALLLAMAGLYGLLLHVVLCRSREMGIRAALGAQRAALVWLVVRDGLQPVAKGLILGTSIGLLTPVVARAFVLIDITPIAPWQLLLLPMPFIAAALVATWLPAAKASRIDPTAVLRQL